MANQIYNKFGQLVDVGAPGQPAPQQPNPTAAAFTQPQAQPQQFDINALIAMLTQAQTQQQQMQQQGQQGMLRELTGGIRRDMSGNPIDPMGSGNAFDNGFFKSGASDLTPEQLAQSQGGNAINQWKMPQMFGPQNPQPLPQAQTSYSGPEPFWRRTIGTGVKPRLPDLPTPTSSYKPRF